MRRIDLAIIAALALAAVGSAIGVVTYEDDRLAAFRVSWTTSQSEVEAPSATVTGPGDAETTFTLPQANLTRLDARVTVGGGAARVAATAVRVELVGPNNLTVAEESALPVGPTASVEIPLTIELAPMPESDRVTAPSAELARAALNGTLSSTQGMGPWTLRASFAPSAPGPLAGETYTVSALVTVTTYAADVAPQTPEVGR